MTSDAPSAARAPQSVHRYFLAVCGFAFLLALACSLVCYFEVGGSLGLFIGGIASAALLLPYLTRFDTRASRELLIALAYPLAIAIVWLVASFQFGIPILQLVKSVLVLAAFSFAIVSLKSALMRATRCDVVASAITVVLALAWLSWPIWMSRGVVGHQTLAGWLVRLHPIFAINGAMPQLGTWTHQPLMYHLTNLGQDVPYELPASIWPCAIAHLMIGAALVAANIHRILPDPSRG